MPTAYNERQDGSRVVNQQETIAARGAARSSISTAVVTAQGKTGATFAEVGRLLY